MKNIAAHSLIIASLPSRKGAARQGFKRARIIDMSLIEQTREADP